MKFLTLALTTVITILGSSALYAETNTMTNSEYSPAKVEQWVKNYFAATRSGSAETWAATFANNAVVEDPVGSPPLTDSAAILAQGEGFVNAFAEIGLYESFIHVNGKEAVAMWQGRGKTADGESVSFEGVDLFEFNTEGKITLLRGFWTPPGAE